MADWAKSAAVALALAFTVSAAPASAEVFHYTMTNGDRLVISNDGTGSWTGAQIDASFTGDFSELDGGPNPSLMLKSKGSDWISLWAWWDDPVVAGNDFNKIHHFRAKSATQVSAPGVVALLAAALMALGFGRRSRRKRTDL